MAGVTSATGVTAVDGTSPTSPILAPDGTLAAPSYSFASQTGSGISLVSGSLQFGLSGVLGFSANSGGILMGGKAISFSNGGGAPSLIQDASDILALKDVGNTATAFRVYAGNGGFIANVQSVTESLTIAAAATTVSVTSIPANAILLGVSVRVTTVIPTAATFTYATTVGATALSTAAVSTSANSTDPGTAAGASYRAAATTVTITPNVTPGAATGVVRLQYYYLQITPPTS